MVNVRKFFDDMYERMNPEEKTEWDEMRRQTELADKKNQQTAGKLFSLKREEFKNYMKELNYSYDAVMTSLIMVLSSLENYFPAFEEQKTTSTIDPNTEKLFQVSFKKVDEIVEKQNVKDAMRYYNSINAVHSYLEEDHLAYLNDSFFQYTTEKLINLFQQTTWNDVLKGLKTIYSSLEEESIVLHQKAYDTILDLEPVPEVKDRELVIYVEMENNQPNVYGRYKNTSEVYALGLSRWGDWLAALVSTKQVGSIGKELFVAACLDEMTTYGWEPSDITEVNADLEEKIDDIKNKIDEMGD